MAGIIGNASNILRITVARSCNARASASAHPNAYDSVRLNRSIASVELTGKHAFRCSLNKIFLFWDGLPTGHTWRCGKRCRRSASCSIRLRSGRLTKPYATRFSPAMRTRCTPFHPRLSAARSGPRASRASSQSLPLCDIQSPLATTRVSHRPRWCKWKTSRRQPPGRRAN